MNAITAPKSISQNRLEGFVLTALFQGFPTFAVAALMLKFTGSHEIVGTRYGAAIFVVLASLLFAMLTPWLGRNSRAASGMATSRCSSTPACPSSKRSRAGGPSR